MAATRKKRTAPERPASPQPPSEHTLCVNLETGRMARVATARLEHTDRYRPVTDKELAELDELNTTADPATEQ